MKALLLALIAVGCLDIVADHGNGVRGCLALASRLIDHTQRDVSESVYRQ